MFPVNNFEGIAAQESWICERHVIIFLLIKPSDEGAEKIIAQFNYLHHRAGPYCSIYPIGYSKDFFGLYKDVQQVKGVNNEVWLYSDKCFIDFCDSLSQTLKGWSYCGDLELIVLQNKVGEQGGSLDFQGYNDIDVNYGIQKGYIDSFERFMQRLLIACKKEVDSYNVIKESNRQRLKLRSVLAYAIDRIPKVPRPFKMILKDQLFFKTTYPKEK